MAVRQANTLAGQVQTFSDSHEDNDQSMTKQIPIVVLGIGIIAIASSVTSCRWRDVGDLEKGERMSGKTIEQVLDDGTHEWMAIPGVEGTAIGLFEGKPCITVFASVEPQELRAKIPSTIEGYPVIIKKTGIFRALEQE